MNRMALDQYALRAKSVYAIGGFGIETAPRESENPKAQTVAIREGVHSVDCYTQLTQSMFAHEAKRAGRGSWGKKVDSPPAAHTLSGREGMDAYAIVRMGLFNQQHERASFSYQRQEADKSTYGSARREGVIMGMDAYIGQAQSMFGYGTASGWGKSIANYGSYNSTLNAHAANGREGVVHTRETVLPDRIGLVLPYEGSYPILLKRPPVKCETIGDYGENRLYEMSEAWVLYPHMLADLVWDAAREGLPLTCDDMLDMARFALYDMPVYTPLNDAVYEAAYEYLADTLYGLMVTRFKRAQVEQRPPLQVIETYQHETSLILAIPPADITDTDGADMAKALISAVGDRAAILPPESVAANILAGNGFGRTENLYHSWAKE